MNSVVQGDTAASLAARLEAEADWLDRAQGEYDPFGSATWLRHFVAEVVDDRQMQAVPVQAGAGEQRALMLLSRDPAQPWLLRGLCNYYASLYAPLYTTAPDRAAAARALVRQLEQQRPGCAVLQLSPLSAESADTATLRAAFDAAGWYTRSYFCFGNWTLPCAGLSFADYMKGRDSQLQNTWSRKAKKFSGKGEARLQLVTRPEDVAAAMDAYEAVYAKSWKKPEPYPHFVRGWAETCARAGWLRLGVAWVGEVPIAAQFWFVAHRRAYIFKLAYDEEYSKWSAGTVLTAHLMQHALDVDQVVEVDYLTGDDPYKKAWMTQRRERIGLLACNLRTPRGLAFAAREWLASKVRAWRPATDTGPTR